MTSNTNGQPARNVVTIAGEERRLERISARKASRAFAILRAIANEAPELAQAWGEFEAEYAESHYIELDRAQAEYRFGPEPLVVEGQVVRYEAGHDRAGDVVMLPGALERMTDEAWASTGNKLRLPRSPSLEEKVLNVVTKAAANDDDELAAERHIYRLAALLLMPNADVKRYRREGSLNEKLDELADEVLDEAGLEELLELVVAAGEAVDAQFRGKVDELGDRLGNALRALGINLAPQRAQTAAQDPQTPTQTMDGETTSSDTRSTSRPTSYGDGAESSDTTPTPSSINPGTSSELSELEPSASG